jgi:hypothetical protein
LRAFAIRPYVVTFPRGIWLVSAYTEAWNGVTFMGFVVAGAEVCLTGRVLAMRGLTTDVGYGGFYVWW